jgi:hypothetical protein
MPIGSNRHLTCRLGSDKTRSKKHGFLASHHDSVTIGSCAHCAGRAGRPAGPCHILDDELLSDSGRARDIINLTHRVRVDEMLTQEERKLLAFRRRMSGTENSYYRLLGCDFSRKRAAALAGIGRARAPVRAAASKHRR